MKPLNLNKSIYELTREYPELVEIMVEIGFKDVANPFTLKTAGKVMTIPKGCTMKGYDLDNIKSVLRNKGFETIS